MLKRKAKMPRGVDVQSIAGISSAATPSLESEQCTSYAQLFARGILDPTRDMVSKVLLMISGKDLERTIEQEIEN
ncbi:hypothetical protein E6O75_ATG10817 [Venturia nashicola]|uniref:Uncharacterized protein n=1 Tax=Venturia nashicola TaxID=86259 RepID=A0A4Z1P0C5_9PEZI|nr:hypothetical protein E6O75_ATG10817 [Venturia nashicola]